MMRCPREYLILGISLLLAATGVGSLAGDQGRGIAVQGLEQELGGPIYADSWALIVGINRYPPGGVFPTLNFANADAKAVRDLLVTWYGFKKDHITFLLDEEATRERILASFNDMAAKTKPNDRVIFYFSGHGHTVDLPHEGKRGYLVPADAKVMEEDHGRAARIEQLCLSMTALRNTAKTMEARHVLFLVDACYSGLAISGRSAREVPYHLKTVAVRPMVGIVTAGQAGEQAQEMTELAHGCFTRKLLDALTPVAGTVLADTEPRDHPDGVVTLKELTSYLVTAVAQVTEGKQNPQDAQEGEGQFLFIPDAGAGGGQKKAPGNTAQNEPLVTAATLSVTSTPPGATVSVDKEQRGVTPLTLTFDLGVEEKKTVEVVTQAAGYQSNGGRITLTRGQKVERNISLAKLADDTGKPTVPQPNRGEQEPTGQQTLAVLELRVEGAESADQATAISSALSDVVRTEVINAKNYRVLSRDKMKEILGEQKFREMMVTNDRGFQVQMGKMLAAQLLVLGRVTRLGSAYTVHLEVVDVNTTDLRNAKTEIVKSTDLADLIAAVQKVVTNMHLVQ